MPALLLTAQQVMRDADGAEFRRVSSSHLIIPHSTNFELGAGESVVLNCCYLNRCGMTWYPRGVTNDDMCRQARSQLREGRDQQPDQPNVGVQVPQWQHSSNCTAPAKPAGEPLGAQ